MSENHSHQKWLINSGFLTELHKNNLYMYGALASTGVVGVELAIDTDHKRVEYVLYLNNATYKAYKTFYQLLNSQSIISLWRLRRILKKFGDLNLSKIVGRFVSDYCGSNWTTVVEVKHERDYVSGEFDAVGDNTRTNS